MTDMSGKVRKSFKDSNNNYANYHKMKTYYHACVHEEVAKYTRCSNHRKWAERVNNTIRDLLEFETAYVAVAEFAREHELFEGGAQFKDMIKGDM